jgi:GDSL-like lipase/acylhydrolase family protein
MMASHVALLGDSIFDNRSYTAGAPDVVTHLRDLLPAPWQATLCAVDGSTAADLADQLAEVPADASHVVISVGGNDALLNSDLLLTPVSSTAEALVLFGERLGRFEAAYRAAIDGALALRRDTTVCTIYNGNLEAREAPLARVALMMFNDVILRVAVERALRVIDLRLVCTEPADYANPIEPSGPGGRKIARAIARCLGAAAGEGHPATVYGG